jgi:hypothetical protein
MNLPNLSAEAICRILGAKHPVPLTPEAMAKSLRVAFYPGTICSNKLEFFLEKLQSCLISSGVKVISYEDALAEGDDGRIGKGIVLIAAGEGQPGNLAIDHVASLSNNTVVGVLDGTSPSLRGSVLQKRVDALVSALVWHMAHVLIYVDELTWTTCNMNGGIDTYALEALEDRVLHSLIPKLAAPVVPLQKGDFDVHENAFDPSASEYKDQVSDLLAGAETWGKTGLLMSQTKIDELAFRNTKYRRIAVAFLSWRTGMSYGFLARQLPVFIKPAIDLDEAPRLLKLLNWQEKDFYEVDGHVCIGLRLRTKRFLIRIPKISFLCTRSGCEKTRLDPASDLLKLTLTNGRVVVGTPKEIGGESDCQPSFDTTTILAHGLGNAIVASVLEKLRPSSPFCRTLKEQGLALAHWHGFIRAHELPAGCYVHGETSPPVSCSTPQAAIYAFSGKIAAVERSLDEGVEFVSDAHVEPSHGTNMTGTSLTKLAELVARAAM